MIRYALRCEQAHEFEGWFSASQDFEDQRDGGLLCCPLCGSKSVAKQIMAPAVASRREPQAASEVGRSKMMMEAMHKVRRHVEETFDYVGGRFAAEARLIHQGKAEERGIYGEATSKEVKSLVEEGVPVAPLPPEPPKKTEVN
ncbi:MAG: DUF1178 family protein [Caulobacteraceae bacterium]